jgi:glycosyl-4,4'-diaponeurosporenoate acyltransferase
VLIELGAVELVLANIVGWVTVSFVAGYVQARRTASAFAPGLLGRIRAWERHGRWYHDVLRVHRWKDRLPEAGTWFGGLSKKHLPSPDQGGLARFAQECLRAERTHGWTMAGWFLFWIWNPVVGIVANALFALAANLPCLVAARSNRARVEYALSRRALRAGSG